MGSCKPVMGYYVDQRGSVNTVPDIDEQVRFSKADNERSFQLVSKNETR